MVRSNRSVTTPRNTQAGREQCKAKTSCRHGKICREPAAIAGLIATASFVEH
jgi:hypothetical protein